MKHRIFFWSSLAIIIGTLFLSSSATFAGAPELWQLGFQEAATPVMERINSFHNMLLVITALISIFVLILLAIIIFRFNAKSNPEPSKNNS